MATLKISNGKCIDKENTCLEFKTCKNGLSTTIWDTYSSFANTYGGIIALGIADDGTIEGVSESEKHIREIWNNLNNRQVVSRNILTEKNVSTMDCEGKTLILIEVPRADRYLRPIYHRSIETGTFKRCGEGDYVCTMDEVSAMLRDQSQSPSDGTPMPDTSFDDIDIQTLQRFRNEMKVYMPNHYWNDESDEIFAELIGAMTKKDGQKVLTLAGLVMFGKEHIIYRYLPDFKLDYREYSEANERWDNRLVSGDGTWVGNVMNFFTKVRGAISFNFKKPFALDRNMRRIEDTDDRIAVRECLVNSMIHCDYYGSLTVLVERRPDSISISNSGTFLVPIPEAENGGCSEPRNKVMSKMFSMIGFAERAGMGVKYVIHTWMRMYGIIPIIAEDVGKRVSKVELATIPKKEDVDAIILKMIEDQPRISIVKISESTGIPSTKITNHISSLKKKGKIERIGGNRGEWKIIQR